MPRALDPCVTDGAMLRVRGINKVPSKSAGIRHGRTQEADKWDGGFLADHQCLAIAQDVTFGHAIYLVGHSTKATVVNNAAANEQLKNAVATAFASNQRSVHVYTGNCLQGIIACLRVLSQSRVDKPNSTEIMRVCLT